MHSHCALAGQLVDVSAGDFLRLRTMSANSKQKIFLIWAVSATVVAVIALNVAFFLFMRLREFSVAEDLSETAGVATNATDAAPFLTLKESDIPGRWRWKHPDDEYIMTLYPDHTFSNKGGERLPVYRWEILPDGFILVWNRGTTRFTVMESPRAFISPHQGRQRTIRLEKVD